MRTFFVTKEFESLENFIETIFPDSYRNLHLGLKMRIENLSTPVYQQLEHQFRKFVVETYDTKIEDYVKKETEFSDVEETKGLIISAIAIKFSVKEKYNDCIVMDRYFDRQHHLHHL